MPHDRTAAELIRVRDELLDTLDTLAAADAPDEEMQDIAEAIDDLTQELWTLDR